MAITEDLLKILRCPKCKGKLEFKGDKLICSKCKARYEVIDNIPIMLVK